MSDLHIDAMVPGLSTDSRRGRRARQIPRIRWRLDARDGQRRLSPHPLIADRTNTIQQGTRIALSFTRSPMALAYATWDLAQYSDGRFTLGIGTQVKGHNERRFSVDWASPGPRLREVVESLRHIFDVFQGEAELDYDGEHYSFSLMTDNFNPGPIDHPDIPIYIAGVNEYNIRLAGEVCDGLAMHPFNTPGYTDEVIAPTVAEGADREGPLAREHLALREPVRRDGRHRGGTRSITGGGAPAYRLLRQHPDLPRRARPPRLALRRRGATRPLEGPALGGDDRPRHRRNGGDVCDRSAAQRGTRPGRGTATAALPIGSSSRSITARPF